jgi:hypothetical protein
MSYGLQATQALARHHRASNCRSRHIILINYFPQTLQYKSFKSINLSKMQCSYELNTNTRATGNRIDLRAGTSIGAINQARGATTGSVLVIASKGLQCVVYT